MFMMRTLSLSAIFVNNNDIILSVASPLGIEFDFGDFEELAG
jgi:hypothetical protein